MITLTQYKTYDGVDLTKCKLYKFTYEIEGTLDIWYREGYNDSSGSFKLIPSNMFNAPQPLTFSISPEVKDVLIKASGSLNESIIDKFVIAKNIVPGSVDD